MKTFWRLLEDCETIQDGDELLDGNKWIYARTYPIVVCDSYMVIRRRINVAEIGETLYREDRGVFEPVTHREVTEKSGSSIIIDSLSAQNKAFRIRIDELRAENEQLKKAQVVWEKTVIRDKYVFQPDGHNSLRVIYNGYGCTIPLPPDEVDPAEKAWEEACFPNDAITKQGFLAGFRAAQAKTKEAV